MAVNFGNSSSLSNLNLNAYKPATSSGLTTTASYTPTGQEFPIQTQVPINPSNATFSYPKSTPSVSTPSTSYPTSYPTTSYGYPSTPSYGYPSTGYGYPGVGYGYPSAPSAPKAPPVTYNPVPKGVAPGSSTGTGGSNPWANPSTPSSGGSPGGGYTPPWMMPGGAPGGASSNPSAPGLRPLAPGGASAAPAPGMPGMPASGAPKQQQAAAGQQMSPGLANLSAMLLGMSPSMSQTMNLNIPTNQKLPFQLGRDFGGDNPYLSMTPGFNPLGILGKSWGA